MALVQCPECGKQISEMAGKCPNCGFPITKSSPNAQRDFRNEIKQNYEPTERDTRPKTWRIVIGVLSCVLFFLMLFQSCAVGAANAILENGSSSGTAGFLCAVSILAGGIIGMCTNNSKGGTITAGVLYAAGGVVGILNVGDYLDLAIWSLVSFAFSITYLSYGIRWEKHYD